MNSTVALVQIPLEQGRLACLCQTEHPQSPRQLVSDSTHCLLCLLRILWLGFLPGEMFKRQPKSSYSSSGGSENCFLLASILARERRNTLGQHHRIDLVVLRPADHHAQFRFPWLSVRCIRFQGPEGWDGLADLLRTHCLKMRQRCCEQRIIWLSETAAGALNPFFHQGLRRWSLRQWNFHLPLL